jgi:cytochrome c oxidase subunit II
MMAVMTIPRGWRYFVLPTVAGVLLCGCSGWQSALAPGSSVAADLARLFWFFVIVCATVWLLVIAALAYIAIRRRGGDDTPEMDSPQQRQGKTVVVGSAVGVTAILLTMFSIASFYTTRSFAWPDMKALTITVTGHQWWWQLDYHGSDPSQIFTTANEIHIPVGRPVTLVLQSGDVIHSFWVPGLMGKQDLIPGRTNLLTIRADRPGLYRGQCAEFCGEEHAHMAIFVFAEPESEFEAWRKHQLAITSASPTTERGRLVFMTGPCAACHTISGTDAGGNVGPDLTHFGGRSTIAAGRLGNTPANLLHWISDPQGLKPHNGMPNVPMTNADRRAVVAYLESLK